MRAIVPCFSCYSKNDPSGNVTTVQIKPIPCTHLKEKTLLINISENFWRNAK